MCIYIYAIIYIYIVAYNDLPNVSVVYNVCVV